MDTSAAFPKVLIDGVFFQLGKTGIARVWSELLREWAANGFAAHLVLLDRDGTAPAIPGIRSCVLPRYDYDTTGSDSQLLQDLCDREQADLFMSTYYTTPLTTPSVFFAYDMIPEVLGMDLQAAKWREKHHGIHHASAYIAISQSTANDLCAAFPHINPKRITVAHPGIGPDFTPPGAEVGARFRDRNHITKPYYLIVGERVGPGGYKNVPLFFQAFARLPDRERYAVVCTGGAAQLEPKLAVLAEGWEPHLLYLNDHDLRAAYSGAVALVYPSRYEGFGLPILESLACGCPVITCRNSSIPEVAGDAALYVNEAGPDELFNTLQQIQEPAIRQALIERGLEQARKFSWPEMAARVAQVCVAVAHQLQQNSIARPAPLWRAFRSQQAELQQRLQDSRQLLCQARAQLQEREAQLQDSQGHVHGLHQEILAMQSSKFWKMRTSWLRSKQGLARIARPFLAGRGPAV